MSKAAKKNHQLVIDAIKKTGLPIVEIWFFGSRARNEHKPGCDWDYLVLVKHIETGVWNSNKDVLEALQPFSKAHIQVSEKCFQDNIGTIGYWAKKEGKLIHSAS